MSQAPKVLYPALVVAAISVTVFSALGIETLLNRTPLAHSMGQTQKSGADGVSGHGEADTSPAGNKWREPSANDGAVPVDGSTGRFVVDSSADDRQGRSNAFPQPLAAASVCNDCGEIVSIRRIETAGQGSGVGAIAGGVAGALLGNQMGAGNGRVAMTLLGGAGGAYAGNTVEKNMHKRSAYQIRVRMDNGKLRTVTQHETPDFRAGDRVRIKQGALWPV
ncbi:MAG: glycine zipper 2TM domain-containing protein [Rugosibacter sp.]|nr:hypothetical protein [Rugosibacter sp.]